MAGPFDLFMTGMQSANQIISGTTKIQQDMRQHDREIEFVTAATEYRKFRQDFLENLPQETSNPDDYLKIWEERSREWIKGHPINDHRVQERFQVFVGQEEAASHNRVSEMAFSRRREQGLASLERSLETARSLAPDEAYESGRAAIFAAERSGYISEHQREQMVIQFEQEVLYDAARSQVFDLFQTDGYQAAHGYIQDPGLRMSDQNRSRLITTLNQMSNAQERERRERTEAEDEQFYQMHRRRDLTHETIEDAGYLDVNRKEWWHNRLYAEEQAIHDTGAGITTDTGRDLMSSLFNRINVLPINDRDNRFRINDEAFQAYTRDEVSYADWQRVENYEGNDWLGGAEEHLKSLLRDYEWPEGQSQPRMLREFRNMLIRDRYIIENEDGSFRVHESVDAKTEDQMMQAAQNFRRDYIEPQLVHRLDANLSGRRDSAMQGVERDIEDGHYLGVVDRNREQLQIVADRQQNQIVNEYSRTQGFSGAQQIGYMSDGRPRFSITMLEGPAPTEAPPYTPQRRVSYEVAYFSRTPGSTQEEPGERRLYVRNGNQWVLMPPAPASENASSGNIFSGIIDGLGRAGQATGETARGATQRVDEAPSGRIMGRP